MLQNIYFLVLQNFDDLLDDQALLRQNLKVPYSKEIVRSRRRVILQIIWSISLVTTWSVGISCTYRHRRRLVILTYCLIIIVIILPKAVAKIVVSKLIISKIVISKIRQN